MEVNNKDADACWNKILYGERILSDEEAEEMLEMSKKLRKEWGFRKRENF